MTPRCTMQATATLSRPRPARSGPGREITARRQNAPHFILLALILPALASAQPACPPPPEPTSARSWDLPAGCAAPFDVRAYTVLADLKLRLRVAEAEQAAPVAPAPARTLPPWAWAALAGGAAMLAPLASCETGEVGCETGGGAQLGLSGLAGALAGIVALVVED